MSRDLFAFGSVAGYARRRWTLAVSIVLHAGALAGILALSVASIADGPQVVRRLHAFITSATPPVAPASPPADTLTSRSASRPSVTSPPLEAPYGIRTELPPSPASLDAGAPGSLGAVASTLPSTIGVGTEAPLSSVPPKAREIPRVGGDIKPPERVVYVPPVYPAIAQQARVQGEVVLDATLDETGAVRDLKVLKSSPLLDRAAIDAVSKWRYVPTRLNGVAVPVKMSITVVFALH